MQKHNFDIKTIEVLVTVAARIVKKLLVKYARSQNLVTNLTEFALYHIYNETSVNKCTSIMRTNFGVASNDKIAQEALNNLIMEASLDGPRGNWSLEFRDYVCMHCTPIKPRYCT